MRSVAGLLGLSAACAMLLSGGAWLEPAIAQGASCKAGAVVVTGSPKGKEQGEDAAVADAIEKWEQDVGAKFGPQWKNWDSAKDTKYSCTPSKSAGGIGCTVSARPCAGFADNAPRGGAAPRDDGGRRGKSEDARRGGGEGEEAKRGYGVYEREMEYQERLAAERRRAESEAYEREMARQQKAADDRRKYERY